MELTSYSAYTPCSVSSLIQGLSNGQIVVPSFQREPAWSAEARLSFVRSLLRGFPSGILYFRHVLKDGLEKWEIVDGRNRLTAIQSFVEGRMQGMFEKEDMEKILGITMDARILYNFSEDDVQEIFYVIQGGVPLFSGERLIASKCPLRKVLLEDLSKEFTRFSETCRSVGIKNEHRGDLSNACCVGIMSMSHDFRHIDGLKSMTIYMDKITNVGEEEKKRIGEVLTCFCDAFEGLSVTLLKSELFSICFLIQTLLYRETPVEWKTFGSFYCDTFAYRHSHSKNGISQRDPTTASLSYYATTKTNPNSHGNLAIRRRILWAEVYSHFFASTSRIFQTDAWRSFEDQHPEFKIKIIESGFSLSLPNIRQDMPNISTSPPKCQGPPKKRRKYMCNEQ